jgi:hypothetical protein
MNFFLSLFAISFVAFPSTTMGFSIGSSGPAMTRNGNALMMVKDPGMKTQVSTNKNRKPLY